MLYSEKDSEGPPSVQVTEGEGNLSLLLGALKKYTMYKLQVLAYTQMGDGPPSNLILLRTKEDGRSSISVSVSLLAFVQKFFNFSAVLTNLQQFFTFLHFAVSTDTLSVSVCVSVWHQMQRPGNHCRHFRIAATCYTQANSHIQRLTLVHKNKQKEAHTCSHAHTHTHSHHPLSSSVTFEKFFSFQDETRTGKSIPCNV